MPQREVLRDTSEVEVEPDVLLSAVVAAAPLPPGPPPKKPPRTFEHDVYVKSKSVKRGSTPVGDGCDHDDPSETSSASTIMMSMPTFNKQSSTLTRSTGVRNKEKPVPPVRGSSSRSSTSSNVAAEANDDAFARGRRVSGGVAASVLKRCRSEEHVYAVPYAETGFKARNEPVFFARSLATCAKIPENDVLSLGGEKADNKSLELHYSVSCFFFSFLSRVDYRWEGSKFSGRLIVIDNSFYCERASIFQSYHN